MQASAPRRLTLLFALPLLAGLLSLSVFAEQEALDDLLERAARLNVTAPWPESDAVLDQIEPRLEEASDEQRAQFLMMRARNQALAGNMQTAVDNVPLMLALEISPERRLRILGFGANVAMLARHHELAFDYLNRGLALEPEVADVTQRAIFYNQASHMHSDVGEWSRARSYGERAMNLAVQSGDQRTQCASAYRLAYARKSADEQEAAVPAYRRALELCQVAGDPVFTAAVQFGLADTMHRLGRLAEADRLFEQALHGHRAANYLSGQAETRLRWADLHFSQNRVEPARQLLQDLEQELTRLQRWDLLADYHDLRSRMARRNGDFIQALSHQDAHIEARERFLDHDRALRLAYLEVAFESQVKEQELALLREQARVAALQEESRRQQQRLRILGYLVAAFLAVLLVLLLWHALRERRHYRDLSVIDSLTGLLNHTRFFDAARPLIEGGGQKRSPLTLVLADIDHFKEVNDQHGHLMGDEVLRQIARCFKDSLADHGLVGRIGGEEFAACLPGMSLEQALVLVESLRQALTRCDLGEVKDRITMSFGIAELQPGEGLESIRQRADEALYRAKHEGRDRIVLAERKPV